MAELLACSAGPALHMFRTHQHAAQITSKCMSTCCHCYDAAYGSVQAAVHHLTRQVTSMLAMQQKHSEETQKQRDMLQAVMLSYNTQSKLTSGNTGLLLQLYKAQLQYGSQPTGLPCKRLADDSSAAAQPVSQCAQRRKKQEVDNLKC